MPDRLDEALVASSLQALPNWTGDSVSISRTVSASGSEADDLLRSLAESAESMNHHPEIERDADSVRIVLSTHSAGGVTVLDITMASVIEDLVAHATGEPAEHVHHAPPMSTDESAPPSQDAAQRQDEAAGEPLIGAPSADGGSQSVPLPSAEPNQPEPGVAEEQESPQR